mmetsp:Transcript_32778/g.81618  ORF Transcript_32778/g.81618 Transcript_32778/m.81618 type:complete len:224 (-) Transcript_32778:468-1139(-)
MHPAGCLDIRLPVLPARHAQPEILRIVAPHLCWRRGIYHNRSRVSGKRLRGILLGEHLVGRACVPTYVRQVSSRRIAAREPLDTSAVHQHVLGDPRPCDRPPGGRGVGLSTRRCVTRLSGYRMAAALLRYWNRHLLGWVLVPERGYGDHLFCRWSDEQDAHCNSECAHLGQARQRLWYWLSMFLSRWRISLSAVSPARGCKAFRVTGFRRNGFETIERRLREV